MKKSFFFNNNYGICSLIIYFFCMLIYLYSTELVAVTPRTSTYAKISNSPKE